MNPTHSCPECGQPLPADSQHQLCPACLLAQALASQTHAEPKPPAAPPPTPEEIAGQFPQFEILGCLGRGGMGVVYQARQKSLNRLVAIKILAPECARAAHFAERFAREAELLAKLSHPHIVTIHDFGVTGGLYYLVMEYVDGVNLRDLLRDGRLEPKQALAIVPELCDALQYAHDRGIVHRDIKPENILLDRRGHVKIADFGLAKLVASSAPAEHSIGHWSLDIGHSADPAGGGLTEAGKIMGTPSYMAPEQSTHPAEVDHRADIYALGVVFYQMLTGELPAETIAPPSRKVQIDVRLDEVVLRALEKEPSRRWQQASAMKTQVETIVADPGPPRVGARLSPVAPDSADMGGTPMPPEPTGETPVSPGMGAQPPPVATLPFLAVAPLKSARGWFTTPENLATIRGGFMQRQGTGELSLYADRLVFSAGWQRTEIPFARLHEVRMARVPLWRNPLGHVMLGLTYEEAGQSRRLLFILGEARFRAVGETRAAAAEWIVAIGRVLEAGTGRKLPELPHDPVVVPASPWVLLLVAAGPGLPLGLNLWLLLSGQRNVGLLELYLLAFSLGMAAFVALGLWLNRRATHLPPPGSAADRAPRLSRPAMVGAGWTLFAVSLLLWFFIKIPPAGAPRFTWWRLTNEPARQAAIAGALGASIHAWWLRLLAGLVLAAPFGTTILGGLAVMQIRRSGGRVYGLGLAMFDGLWFPLLALDFGALILAVAVGGWLLRLQAQAQSNSGGLALALLLVQFLIGVPLLDWLIIRRVWRAGRPPPPGSPGLPPAPGSQGLVARWLARLALGLVSLSGILALATWLKMPAPGQILQWSLFLTALLGGLLAIPVRRTRLGRWALIGGGIHPAIWLLIAAGYIFWPGHQTVRAGIYLARGDVKTQQGDFPGALGDYNRARELDPQSAGAYLGRGYVEAEQEDYPAALGDYTHAVELRPDDSLAYERRGVVRQIQGDAAGAQADYDQAIMRKYESAPYLRLYRELLQLQQGTAPRDFAPYVEGWKDSWVKTLGRFLTGKLEEKDLFAAADTSDEEPVTGQQCEAWYFAGMMRLHRGEEPVAREYFEKAVGTGLKDYNEYAFARAELARLDAAVKK